MDIADFLEAGKEVVLRVGERINPRTDNIGFEPIFSQLDPNVTKSYPPPQYPEEFLDFCEDDHFGSVRFFNPVNNGFTLCRHEVWRARVEKITIHPNKRTRDWKRYVFIDVWVLGREEVIEQEYDQILKQWVTRTLSGSVTIKAMREPAERTIRDFRTKVPAQPARYYGQQQEVVLSVEEIRVGEKIVQQKIIGGMTRETYKRVKEVEAENIKHPFGKPIDSKTRRKLMASIPAYENFPQLPKEIEIPGNLLIF